MIPNMYLPFDLHIIDVAYGLNACDWMCAFVGVCMWEWGLRMAASSNLPCSVNCLHLQQKCANEHTADSDKTQILFFRNTPGSG